MNTFDPVSYSFVENRFLLEHLGKPPIVAMQALTPPINPRAVKPIIDRVYELEELRKHSGQEWVGVEKVKDAIRTYLAQVEKWEKDRRRGAPRFPSLYTFDARGRAHRYGPGSDSGRIRTYFDSKGNRIPFAIDLVATDAEAEYVPEWIAAPAPTEKKLELIVDPDKRRIECSVCGHTESFNPESRASFNAARARISKHLRKSTDNIDLHRELHTAEFGN